VMNTKLQLLVRRAKLKFARVLFLKSFYRTTVINCNAKNRKCFAVPNYPFTFALTKLLNKLVSKLKFI